MEPTSGAVMKCSNFTLCWLLSRLPVSPGQNPVCTLYISRCTAPCVKVEYGREAFSLLACLWQMNLQVFHAFLSGQLFTGRTNFCDPVEFVSFTGSFPLPLRTSSVSPPTPLGERGRLKGSPSCRAAPPGARPSPAVAVKGGEGGRLC